MARVRVTELRRRVYQVLEQGPVGDAMGVVIDRLLVLLILLNLVAVALESVPEYGARYALAFNLIEIVSLVVFTVEYGMRLWVAVEHGPHRHLNGARARLKYALSPAGSTNANQNGSTAARSTMPAGLSAYLSRARAPLRCRCGPCSTATHSRKPYSTVNTTSETISIRLNASA